MQQVTGFWVVKPSLHTEPSHKRDRNTNMPLMHVLIHVDSGGTAMNMTHMRPGVFTHLDCALANSMTPALRVRALRAWALRG